jgi:hypothetical protein
VDDFIGGYYGTAADDVRAYWKLLYATKAKHMNTMAAPPEGIRYSMTSPFLSKEFLDQATAIFAHAVRQCDSEELRDRVELAGLPIMYVKLMQGPSVWGDGYKAMIDDFERIARREHIDFLREGGPDLDEKLQAWRASVQAK